LHHQAEKMLRRISWLVQVKWSKVLPCLCLAHLIRNVSTGQDYRVFHSCRVSGADAALLGVLLPALALLLDPAQSSERGLNSIVLSQVLSFAAGNAGPFREAVGKLDSSTQSTLEASIRLALGKQTNAGNQASTKPQISLRAF
jgi:hypothetical protein